MKNIHENNCADVSHDERAPDKQLLLLNSDSDDLYRDRERI